MSEQDPFVAATIGEEYTGKSVNYYKLQIRHPVSGQDAYMAECQDIIETLGMDFNEANAFKAIWRRAAARTLGLKKKGYDGGLYDAEKVLYAGQRLVATSKAKFVLVIKE